MSIRRGFGFSIAVFVAVAASLCRGVSGQTGRSDGAIALGLRCVHHLQWMEFDYDVVIIGAAFSGAATALVLKRKHPAARVLIIEKSAEFDRKVGESTTELSSCYMTRILGLTNYLGHHHLAKQGLRMWFANQPDQAFDDCVELGAKYQARLPTFQVDRSTLDQHMLEVAMEAGCDLRRPAKVTSIER